VVLGRYGGTIKASGGETLDAQFCHVYDFRDGKAVTFQQYTDTTQWARVTCLVRAPRAIAPREPCTGPITWAVPPGTPRR